ncbi:hypothetical protein AKJ37_01390 [candidate division MSBL1 archaeon SCGC-AAA259I09]|uniref:Bifunctional protein GlmU n=2 Tax=candidate division MSBL1 TaxID=215777 RepID=A0A133UV58_9EURY|nr:hypothetical protein AKJ62_00525 [candidate division MSBL1 archaeon SCGC-AAA259D14]KXA98088.1 hypothetical protein AKJ37_01390 [candidate division MSBL1 archaeon SCGC-AAA259I09]
MKAVILAAGVGERMQPLTQTNPKPLLPVAGRPILDYVLDSLKGTNIRDVILVVGYLQEKIRERYGDGSDLGLKISYVEQPEQKGTADAIDHADSEETFVVVNGDVYCDAQSLKNTIKQHNKQEAIATLGTYRVENAASYGVIKTKNGKISEIIEKPEKTYNQLINAGVYVFEPEIYEFIEKTPLSKRDEKEITTSIELLINSGKLVNATELQEWTHIGRPWDLLVANKKALEKRAHEQKGSIEPGAHVKENVTIEEGALIRSGAYIEGPAYIGENSDIGPNCYIRPHTSIGKNARIGNAVEVKNSIIMDGTHAAHHTYIGDSIIGRNCNFGSGTKIGNLRLDAGNVIMTLRGKLTDTGRRKLGAVLGDGSQTGLNSMVNPGVKMGPNSAIGPGAVLYEDLPSNRCIVVKQKEQERSWKNA